MERLDVDVDAEQPFAYLQRVSQDGKRKLVAVAEDLVRTRRLPDRRNPEPGDGRTGPARAAGYGKILDAWGDDLALMRDIRR